MTGCHAPHDGFVIAPPTCALLMGADLVTVVANSRKVPEEYFQKVLSSEREAFVVFNRHRFTIDDGLAGRTVWVHRLNELTGQYFGDCPEPGSPGTAFHHLLVAEAEPRDVEIPAGASYLSCRARLPGLAGYPVGRKLVIRQHGIRRIVSPSTGFALFALLDVLQRRGARFRIQAVGVGREYNGWPGHDWSFERRQLRAYAIDYRKPDGRPDHWWGILDGLPYELVRAATKLRTW